MAVEEGLPWRALGGSKTRGKGWGQVQALPGFHTQVRPRPEKWPLGPAPCRQEAGMKVVLVMSFEDGCLNLEGSTEK